MPSRPIPPDLKAMADVRAILDTTSDQLGEAGVDRVLEDAIRTYRPAWWQALDDARVAKVAEQRIDRALAGDGQDRAKAAR